MKTEQINLGRPKVKPTRKQTNFAINKHFIDPMQKLMFKLGEDSLNDTYNRIIEEALLKYNVK